QNRTDRKVRDTQRRQVVRFYLWSRHQQTGYQVLGCAAMFAYLTGFRPSEIRPYHVSGLSAAGVRVSNAKRKKGEREVVKLREWSPRLRLVVQRARQLHPAHRMYLFGNATGSPYTRSGWGAQWTDAMFEWIASFDEEVARELEAKKRREVLYREAKKGGAAAPPVHAYTITEHPAYFSLKDVRPAAITSKLEQRSADAYDFAAHANPSTTHKNYDRRKVKKASATE
ncbi:MAG TPA: hypothetical protein VFF16_13455, partial [Telluria sp.]|nr:hypothetical protein [Telluria sp.]